jgi:hypothetical protein
MNKQLPPDNNELDKIVVLQDRKRRFVLYRELATSSTKAWLVKKLLGDCEVSAIYGQPGSGKSVLVEDMALHIAAGRPWHGRAVKQGAVAFIALERRQLVERRAIAFREYHGIADLPFAIIGGVYDFRDARTVAAILEIIRLVEAETREKVVLVVIDTIARALAGGDENSSKDMGALVAATAQLQEQTKASVLLVHHVPIDAAERLRGHGSLLGAMDTTICVEKTEDLRLATVNKANDAEEGQRIAFTLESVTIGQDADGVETTAPVVIEADPATAPTHKSSRKLSARQTMAMTALAETVLSGGKPAPADFELPQGIKVVAQEDWRTELLRRNVIDANGGNPREDFKRTRNQLIARGLIGCRDQFVWAAAL